MVLGEQVQGKVSLSGACEIGATCETAKQGQVGVGDVAWGSDR